jgi:hypothetical protein
VPPLPHHRLHHLLLIVCPPCRAVGRALPASDEGERGAQLRPAAEAGAVAVEVLDDLVHVVRRPVRNVVADAVQGSMLRPARVHGVRR